MDKITVSFSCRRCGLKNVEVEIKARDKDCDLGYWMDHILTPALMRKHTSLSLFCEATSLQDVMLPVGNKEDPDNWVGKYVTGKPPKWSSQ